MGVVIIIVEHTSCTRRCLWLWEISSAELPLCRRGEIVNSVVRSEANTTTAHQNSMDEAYGDSEPMRQRAPADLLLPGGWLSSCAQKIF